MQAVSFHPSAERLALADSALRVLRDRYNANEEPRFLATRWREFAELGWLTAALPEAVGGLALPWSTVSVVAQTLAPAVACEPFSSQVGLIGPLLADATASAVRDELLARWTTGEALLALAHGEDDAAPWTCDTLATRFTRTTTGYVLHGRKALVLDGGLAEHYLVSARDAAGEVALFVLDAAQRGCTREARTSIDARAHVQLTLEAVVVSSAARLDFAQGTAVALASSAWLHALLLSAEALGLLAALLRASHEYLVQRQQFGRPLIEFQVLQHRLVDMLLTLTRIESLLDVARCCCDADGPLAAAPYIAAAKAAAAEEGRALARQAVQLHGAIGLTAELALGRQLRRLMALELLGGSAAQHAEYWARHGAGLGSV